MRGFVVQHAVVEQPEALGVIDLCAWLQLELVQHESQTQRRMLDATVG